MALLPTTERTLKKFLNLKGEAYLIKSFNSNIIMELLIMGTTEGWR